MESKSPRISLSIGRATDGPRTVGDINPHGMSFAIYLIWLFMAVLNPSLAAGVPFLEYSLDVSGAHSVLLYSFFAASTATLIVLGIMDSKINRLSFVPASIIGAVVLCVVGTLGSILSAFIGIWLVALSGMMMGIGSSFFVISWGAIYVRFRFATTVLNASLSYCIAYIVAIVLMHGVPAQIGAIVTLLLPFACIPAMLNANKGASIHAHMDKRPLAKEATTSYSSSSKEKLNVYAVRCWLSLTLLGVVVGALRSICCEEMLWDDSLSTSPMLCGGAMLSIVVMLAALAMSRKESSWDYLFRAITPVVIGGIALIAVPAGGGLLSAFCIALAFICAESLMWIFAANVSKDLGMSVIKMFGVGFGLAQLGSMVGIWLINFIMPLSETYNMAMSAADVLSARGAGLSEMGLLEFKYQVALLALALIAVAAFASAALPRYYELKRMMSGLLNSMAPAAFMMNCPECPREADCNATATIETGANPSEATATTAAPSPSAPDGQFGSETPTIPSQTSALDNAAVNSTTAPRTTENAAAFDEEAESMPSQKAASPTPSTIAPDDAAIASNTTSNATNSKDAPAEDAAQSKVAQNEAMLQAAHRPSAHDSKGSATTSSATTSAPAPERLFNATVIATSSASSSIDDANANAASTDAATAESDANATAANPSEQKAQQRNSKGGFKRKCDEISETYMLSNRERDVLNLLARGHNAAYIMDELCISRSTAKTHINHIYKKMDIHTQQELLSMVEERSRKPQES